MTTFQNIWYWKLAIFECAIDAFIAGALVWMAATANSNWDDLNSTAKATVWLLTIVAILKVWKSLVSTTISDLKKGQPAADAAANAKEVTDAIQTAKVAAISRDAVIAPLAPGVSVAAEEVQMTVDDLKLQAATLAAKSNQAATAATQKDQNDK